MRLFLDGAPLEADARTLAEAMDAARAAAAGRFVVEAIADGAPVPPDDLAAPPDRSPYAAEIRFTSAARADLVRDTLLEAASAASALAGAHAEAAELIQSGRTQEGMVRLGEIIASWQRVLGAVAGAQRVEGVTLDGEPLDGAAAFGAGPAELAPRLAEARDAIAASDWAGVADTLAYDMSPLAERWAESLRDAAGRLAAAPAGAVNA